MARPARAHWRTRTRSVATRTCTRGARAPRWAASSVGDNIEHRHEQERRPVHGHGQNNRTKCVSALVTVTISNAQVLPNITTSTTPSTNCAGGTDNGATSANVGGVTAGFAFQWFAGNAVDCWFWSTNGNGGNTFATNAIAGASKRTIPVQVTNSTTGCVNTKTVTVADNKQNPVLTLTSTANTGCTLAFDGTASQSTLTDANAIGGDTYVYVWSAGAVIGADIGTGTARSRTRTEVNTRPRPRTTGPSAWARPLRLPSPIRRYSQQSQHRQPEHELRWRTDNNERECGRVTAGFAFQWFAATRSPIWSTER